VPEFPYLSSPSWNPNSHLLQPDLQPAYGQTSSLSSPIHPPNLQEEDGNKHQLLDLRLVNSQLRVIVTGGPYNHKELTAAIKSIDGRLVILYKCYTTSTPLSPDWVTPKCPNPTRDNGLLVVIKGDHCGKYVRRIHHRYEGNKPIVLLGVVSRSDGHADKLEEERLELDVSYLCVCEESKEDKKRNSSLMDTVRQEACKIRAK
jgi:hypothetical protein